jgi:hypothetical protein
MVNQNFGPGGTSVSGGTQPDTRAQRFPSPEPGRGGDTPTTPPSRRSSVVTPGPTSIVGYYQDGLFFASVDDVNERKDYYQLSSNNSITMMKGVGGAGSLPDLAGGLVSGINTRFGDITDFITGRDDFSSEDFEARLAGNVGNAMDPNHIDPAIAKVVRANLNHLFDLDVPVHKFSAVDMMRDVVDARNTEAQLFEGEALSDGEWYGEVQEFYDPGASRRRAAATADAPKTDAELLALDAANQIGGDIDGAEGDGSGGGGGGAGKATTGGTSLATGAGGAGGGAFTGTDTVASLPSGPGVGGVEVTGDLLREFVDSDFSLGFNAMMNQFRNAGAAGIFLNWLGGQFNRLLGEYEGNIAQQALNGQVPQGGMTDFLVRKGLLDAPLAGGDAPGFADFASRQQTASAGGGDATGGGGAVGPLPQDTPAVSPSAGETEGLSDAVAELVS